MMRQQNQDTDVESLQQNGRRRGPGCLDVFLAMSVMLLFLVVAAVTVVGGMAVKEVRSELESLRSSPRSSLEVETEKQTGDAPTYKMQDFVYLEAHSSTLQNYTMSWHSIHYGSGTSVGSNFDFNEYQNSLKPMQVGIYFIYVELNLTCVHKCNAGLLSVQVGDKLTCDVELPAVSNKTPVSRKCWTVSQMDDGESLLTQMTVPKEGLKNWKLELSGSGLGMFLVG